MATVEDKERALDQAKDMMHYIVQSVTHYEHAANPADMLEYLYRKMLKLNEDVKSKD